MIRRSVLLMSLVVLGLSVSSAQAQVRDPISRKFSPEKGFFENNARSSTSRAYSSRTYQHKQSGAPARGRWFWRGR
jgi:hypothetical protein